MRTGRALSVEKASGVRWLHAGQRFHHENFTLDATSDKLSLTKLSREFRSFFLYIHWLTATDNAPGNYLSQALNSTVQVAREVSIAVAE